MTKSQHLERVEIRRFRGLSELDLEQLGNFNILLGPNDVGKTSILEAIFLLTGIANLQLPLWIQRFRNLPTREFDDLGHMFHNLDLDHPIDLIGYSSDPIVRSHLRISAPRTELEITGSPSGSNSGNDISRMQHHAEQGVIQASSVVPLGQRILQYDGTIQLRSEKKWSFTGMLRVEENKILGENPVMPAKGFIPSARYITIGSGYEANVISTLIIHKRLADLVSFLQKINPNITDISSRGDLAYVDIGLNKMIPLNLFGSGIVRATNIVAHLMIGGEQILLLDELENGLHYSAVDSFLRMLLTFSHEKKVQIFATTHSLGILKSLLNVLAEEAFSEYHATTCCFTLERDREARVRSYRYGYPEFEHCVRHGIEIR